MIDIRLIRNEPELVKENIRKKFQDEKLELVDQVADLDRQLRESLSKADQLRNQRKVTSKKIGGLLAQGKAEEAEQVKAEVAAIAPMLLELEELERTLSAQIRERMLVIPNIMDVSVPVGRYDSENVEVGRFGEPAMPDFEVPYHIEIMESLSGWIWMLPAKPAATASII